MRDNCKFNQSCSTMNFTAAKAVLAMEFGSDDINSNSSCESLSGISFGLIAKALPALVVQQPPSEPNHSGEDSITEEILFTKRRPLDSSDSNKSHASDKEVVIDYEAQEEKPKTDNAGLVFHHDYYEDVIFNTGIQDNDAKSLHDAYEDVLVRTDPKYENINFNSHADVSEMDEALYSVGRRFPSIRLTSEEKRKAKRKISTPDAKYEVKGDIGSCPRPAAAIYGTKLDLNQSLDTSNIYENGRIVLAQQHEQSRCWRRKKSLRSKVLIFVISASILIFVITGALLLYQSLTGSILASAADGTRSSTEFQVDQPSAAALNYLWSPWSSWSQCSEECLPGESQARTRLCSSPVTGPQTDLRPCLAQGGSNSQLRVCPCTTNGPKTLEVRQDPARPLRFCDDCKLDEVCVAKSDYDSVPTCHPTQDTLDPTGCGGLCPIDQQTCHRLEKDAFRCKKSQHPMEFATKKLSQNCFFCSGKCLSLDKICDGLIDCEQNAEDEKNCGYFHYLNYTNCPEGKFQCGSNEAKCLELHQFCNGFIDCQDGSDEPEGCLTKL